MTHFEQILQKYRDISFSERDKGYRFERLMQSFLKTYPLYEGQFTSIWLWNEFPSRADFGSGDKDLGVDFAVGKRHYQPLNKTAIVFGLTLELPYENF